MGYSEADYRQSIGSSLRATCTGFTPVHTLEFIASWLLLLVEDNLRDYQCSLVCSPLRRELIRSVRCQSRFAVLLSVFINLLVVDTM
jgi:hypothetical protein